jgi:AAA+ superfamily predicted ATPase
MARSRQELEQHLLADPTDTDTRSEYAAALTTANEFAAAARQWMLIARARPDDAGPLVAAADCHRKLGDPDLADVCLANARRCPNFRVEGDGDGGAEADSDDSDSDSGDDGDSTPPARPAQPALALVGGGKPKREVAEVVPLATAAVRFSDVVGMDDLKRTIRVRIVEPFVKPGLFARFGKRAGGGLLLYGPPGCGKTMIAKAIATECQAAFVAVGISDVLSMWVGGSEGNLASLFDKARQQRPAVLFFDELDALAFSRSKAHSDHTRTLVNEFLNQLDGVSGDNDRVLVLAATNMPWDVDGAMKRTGRFDRQIFVPPPDQTARREMFRLKLTAVPIAASVDEEQLAQKTPLYTGADIDGVIELAKERVLSDILDGAEERPIEQADLVAAIGGVQPSALDWLRTARNLVKYAGDGTYRDVESYLKAARLF